MARQPNDQYRADEMEINLVPIFLGAAERLFDGLGEGSPDSST